MRRITEFCGRHLGPLAVALALLVGVNLFATAQGFLWVYPFVGVQPQQSIDFSNPPLTIGIPSNNLTAAQNAASRGTFTPATIPVTGTLATWGTETQFAASGDLYLGSIFVPFNMTTTNCNWLAGTAGTTNAVICVLFNNAGVPIANTALAGTTTPAANTFQAIPWTAPLAIQGPGRYFIGIQPNGTTDYLQTVPTLQAHTTQILTSLTTGTFATIPNPITVPTTFTTAQAPIAFLN